MAIKDVEVTVAGGNTEVRSAVCEAIHGTLSSIGFGEVTNTDADPDLENGDTLMDQALAKYPDILNTPITINAVTSEEEATENAVDADEELSEDEEPVSTDD